MQNRYYVMNKVIKVHVPCQHGQQNLKMCFESMPSLFFLSVTLEQVQATFLRAFVRKQKYFIWEENQWLAVLKRCLDRQLVLIQCQVLSNYSSKNYQNLQNLVATCDGTEFVLFIFLGKAPLVYFAAMAQACDVSISPCQYIEIIIDSFRLEKTFNIIEPNSKPDTAKCFAQHRSISHFFEMNSCSLSAKYSCFS